MARLEHRPDTCGFIPGRGTYKNQQVNVSFSLSKQKNQSVDTNLGTLQNQQSKKSLYEKVFK